MNGRFQWVLWVTLTVGHPVWLHVDATFRGVVDRLRDLANTCVTSGQWLGYRTYFWLVAHNYRMEAIARRNHTPAGTFRSYDLLNRHGADRMLAELDAVAAPDAVIYDVGANVGMYSLALASVSNRELLAFEPAPPIVERLVANVRVNNLGDSIEIHAYGLGDSAATEPFYVSTYPELSGFDRDSATRWGAAVATICSVPVRPLDGVVDPNRPPTVVKLDVEGAGPAVLDGAIETLEEYQPELFIETHETGIGGYPLATMRSQLDSAGYAIEERGDYWRCLPE